MRGASVREGRCECVSVSFEPDGSGATSVLLLLLLLLLRSHLLAVLPTKHLGSPVGPCSLLLVQLLLLVESDR